MMHCGLYLSHLHLLGGVGVFIVAGELLMALISI